MKCTNEKMIWNTQDTNLSWYVSKANVDHTINGKGTAVSTLDHSATIPHCHWMGYVSMSYSDFGYQIIQNNFETSNTKGEQGVAGANVKQKNAIEVIRGEAEITTPRQMYEYLVDNFNTPIRSNSEVKTQVFLFIATSEIERKGRLFQPIPENRKFHSILHQKMTNCYFIKGLQLWSLFI